MKIFIFGLTLTFVISSSASIVTLSPGQTTQVGDVTVTCGTSVVPSANPKFPAGKTQTCAGSFSSDPAIRSCQGSPEGSACTYSGKSGFCYGAPSKDKKDFICRCQ